MESSIHGIKKITLGEIIDLGDGHDQVRKIFVEATNVTYTLTLFGVRKDLEVAIKTENKV